MELRLGSVVSITGDLAGKLTGDNHSDNSRFMITVVTDNSTVLRSSKDNKTYNVRNEVLLNNIKWFDKRFDGRFTNAATNVELPNDSSADETEPDETEPDETEPDETEPDETEPDETDDSYSVEIIANGRVRVNRASANTSFTIKEDDPYADDPYGDVYG